MKIMSFVLVSFMLISLAFAQSTEQQRERRSIDQFVKTVQFLAKRNLFCNTSRDCKVVTFGSRACGGPSEYALTSRYNPNFAQVEDLAERVTDKEAEYNHRYRVNSICTMLIAPSAKCVFRKCQVK